MSKAPPGISSSDAVSGRVTGAEYDRQLTARASDRRTRASFQSLALALAMPGGRLFDFGAGTGIDARRYAERGLTVTAYDADPQMCAFFTEHCRDLIADGRVHLQAGAYRDFVDAHNAAGHDVVDLVTANFAPLNLVGDLRELFAKFHALTRPGGRVLASVLNPYFIGDLRYGWWWRNLGRLWRDGRYVVHGSQGPITRRRLANFATESLPYFRLQRVYPGLRGRGTRKDASIEDSGVDVRDGIGGAWPHLVGNLFMFLLYQRRL